MTISTTAVAVALATLTILYICSFRRLRTRLAVHAVLRIATLFATAAVAVLTTLWIILSLMSILTIGSAILTIATLTAFLSLLAVATILTVATLTLAFMVVATVATTALLLFLGNHTIAAFSQSAKLLLELSIRGFLGQGCSGHQFHLEVL